MTLFYLIRHAESEWGPGDLGLTPAGKAQAAAVGAFLINRSLTCVFSSPLRRARETAAAIAREVGVPVVIDPRLHERMNWGDVADQNWAEFAAEWDRADFDRDYVPIGGISARQAAANLKDFLSDTAQHSLVDTQAAVTHAGILVDFLTEFFSPQELDFLSAGWKSRQEESITHGSITTLRWEADSPRLESLAVVVSP
ncbi:MAG: histidine phosphatase family protein [Chloroflexi bacterium]|nr:MAG: histidine phosphatase family protein [Chloroflexota bacterium]